jgi:hypothetical protein
MGMLIHSNNDSRFAFAAPFFAHKPVTIIILHQRLFIYLLVPEQELYRKLFLAKSILFFLGTQPYAAFWTRILR